MTNDDMSTNQSKSVADENPFKECTDTFWAAIEQRHGNSSFDLSAIEHCLASFTNQEVAYVVNSMKQVNGFDQSVHDEEVEFQIGNFFCKTPGLTPFAYIIRSGCHDRLKAIKMILETGKVDLEGLVVSEDYNHGRTCLMEASAFGNLEIVQCVLLHGASVHSKDYEERTALYHALQTNNLSNQEDIVLTLLRAGSDATVTDITGYRCLHQAVFCKPSVVNMLLEFGAGEWIDEQGLIGGVWEDPAQK